MSRPLRSFKPIAERRSRILIVGTMPGPVALAKKEYYGFPGNHFWPILFDLFATQPVRRVPSYSEKIRLLKSNHIALWDVIQMCFREGAGDGRIRNAAPNDIPRLLKRCPGIRAIFLNGILAERLFQKHFGGRLRIPAIRLPSTSPAYAAMSYRLKREKWTVIKNFLFQGLATKFVLEEIARGEREILEGKGITHADVVKKVESWLE